jgi:hypothetical protein
MKTAEQLRRARSTLREAMQQTAGCPAGTKGHRLFEFAFDMLRVIDWVLDGEIASERWPDHYDDAAATAPHAAIRVQDQLDVLEMFCQARRAGNN